MRYLRLFLVMLLLFLFANGEVEILAMNTRFSTSELPRQDIDMFYANVNITMLVNEPEKKAIECFDVNQDGIIAIGFSNFERKTICIYDENYFLYGYEFNTSGDFAIEWDKDKINIYFIRSDVLASVNSTGEIVDIAKVQDTTENNFYRNNFIYSAKRTVGETEYNLRNDMGILNIFASSYSQLVVSKSSGEENVVYDVNSTQFANTLAVFIAVILFVGFAVLIVIWQFIKLKRYR